MNILIADDDQNKLSQLQSFIERLRPNWHIKVAHSYQSTLQALSDDLFDLLLLDMSMPTYDRTPGENGGRQRPFAGREILHKMGRSAPSTPAVVVTQFTVFGEPPNLVSLSKLRSELEVMYPGNYLGTVYYSAESAGWESALASYIDRL